MLLNSTDNQDGDDDDDAGPLYSLLRLASRDDLLDDTPSHSVTPRRLRVYPKVLSPPILRPPVAPTRQYYPPPGGMTMIVVR